MKGILLNHIIGIWTVFEFNFSFVERIAVCTLLWSFLLTTMIDACPQLAVTKSPLSSNTLRGVTYSMFSVNDDYIIFSDFMLCWKRCLIYTLFLAEVLDTIILPPSITKYFNQVSEAWKIQNWEELKLL